MIALLQDAHSALSGSAEPTVRVIAGICALVMVFLIIFRRNKKKSSEP